jgi:hypothetical protein
MRELTPNGGQLASTPSWRVGACHDDEATAGAPIMPRVVAIPDRFAP